MLNQRGYRFLKECNRRFRMTRRETCGVLERHGIASFEAVIDFQCRFGGYDLDEDVTLGLCFPAATGVTPNSPSIEDRNGTIYFDCVLPTLCQIHFQIDESGTYFEDGSPAAESVDNLIQHYAYLHHVEWRREWTHISQDRLATKRFQGFFDESKLSIVSEASDAYRQVLRNEEMLYIKEPNYCRLFVTPELAKMVGHRKR